MPILKGRDTIAQAQSGTGKTTIFSVGVLHCLDTAQRETQALVLSPTRELAEQTQKVMLALGDYMSVQCHACIGGKSIGEDIRRLDAGVHAVSGTPGRVFDMIRRRNLRTRAIKMLVIDEVRRRGAGRARAKLRGSGGLAPRRRFGRGACGRDGALH